MKAVRWFGMVVLAGSLLLPAASFAEKSAASMGLQKCQQTVGKETGKLRAGIHKALSKCLDKIAKEVVRNDQADPIDVSRAANTCGWMLEKIGRDDDKSLADKMESKVSRKCDPAPSNAHSWQDVFGVGTPGVEQPLGVFGLYTYCGLGAGNMEDWYDCLKDAAECQARQEIGVVYPRAVEWLEAMATALTAEGETDAATEAEDAAATRSRAWCARRWRRRSRWRPAATERSTRVRTATRAT